MMKLGTFISAFMGDTEIIVFRSNKDGLHNEFKGLVFEFRKIDNTTLKDSFVLNVGLEENILIIHVE